MLRLITISTLGLIGAVVASAGAIEIGGPSGITSNYITQGAGAVCAAGAGNCIHGTTTGWAENNYNNILFQGATNNSGATAPSAFTSYTQTGGEPSGLTATDKTGNTFAMLSDGQSGDTSSRNFWLSKGTTSNPVVSILIPIGIGGVTDLWTMMDNAWGSLGGNDTSVTFNFGTSANDTSADVTSITVNLADTSNGATANGEMRAAVSCATTPSATCSNTTNPNGNLQQGTVINGVTVNEGIVYNSFNYTAAGGFYAGTAGKVKLDDQQFVFAPSLGSEFLVSMKVTENLGNNTGTSGLSETALSAITVDAVPEPTTILLLLSGLGGIGFVRSRRRA